MKVDINDTQRTEGTEAVRARHDRAKPYKPQTNGTAHQHRPKARFDLVHIADIAADDEPLWLIEDMIPAGPSLVVIFGKPKSGKTFLTADLFLHVAKGKEYCGCQVRQGAVVYVTSEGIRGFKRRMIAMREHLSVDRSMPFFTVHVMPKLGVACGDAETLIAAIRSAIPSDTPIAAVVIDTLARAMAGQNDADTAAMGIFVENCDTIARALGCCVAAVHHSPRGDDTRSRGSVVLEGAADAIISVVKEDASGISTAKVDRLKDGEEGTSWRFRVTADRNKEGVFRPLCETIGTVARQGETETSRNKKLTGSQQRFMDVLGEAIDDHGAPVKGSTVIPAGIKAVGREQLRKCLFDAGFLDREKPDAARSTFSRSINDLAGKHVIGATDQHIWLPR
ncbi:AAA family ATPase [Bradyrhizobium diazoefficiens]|uniref:AAA+ ATPase domain-containing protein n=1 Tax=Bradyrhizobium diazoefficiens TaxID=1355477 RepID=A0A810BFZ5_9BRAD|nr:AAA family ATPase [Bradyrhizobium diazoefficiens]WLB35607.1 AAA family ATPase [Bradyrhizobium diazoefficiens]WLC19401.1 AAA family ATPase [Bradyrhizobium diazoefficiens]BCE75562.1 hypothetical protein XF8B_56730 [Bradyrhizobium diazoefficiens]